MPGKTIESKLVIKSDIDQASKGVKQLTGDIRALAVQFAQLRDIEMPDLMGGGRGARGGGRRASAAGAPRSPNAPATSGQIGIDAIRERGGFYGRQPFFGWRGAGPPAFGLGFAARAPLMAQQVAAGGMGGGGLPAIGGMMQQIGGGVTGAFGGFGAVVGLPLLISGAMMGLAHMATGPYRKWMGGTAGLGARLGRPMVEGARRSAMLAGIGPDQVAPILGQLEAVGAQGAFGTMMRMRPGGLEPGMLAPVFAAMTRAGGAGMRTPAEYERLGKMIQQATKDLHSVPMFLEKLVDMTAAVEQNTADMGAQGSRELIAIAKWMEAAPTAALRGGRGARVFGAFANWVATPGEPGKEMLIWSTLANNPAFRAQVAARTAGTPGGVVPATGPLSYFQFLRARGTVEAWKPMLGMLAGLPEEMGGIIMTQAGVNAETAAQLLGWQRAGVSQDVIDKGLADAERAGKLGPKGGALDPGMSLQMIESRLSNILVENEKMPKLAESVLATEKQLLEVVSTGIGKVPLSEIVDKLKEFLANLDKWLGGEQNLIQMIGNGVRLGIELAIEKENLIGRGLNVAIPGLPSWFTGVQPERQVDREWSEAATTSEKFAEMLRARRAAREREWRTNPRFKDLVDPE